MNGKRLFLIEKDGSTVSWCPDDAEVQNSSKLWKSLIKQLKNQFGKINVNKDTLKYHPNKNTIKVNTKNNELNKNNIEIYCNKLKSSANSIRMYFYIGNDIPPADVYDDLKENENENENENCKRATIITSKLMNAPKKILRELKKRGDNVVNAQMTMKLGEDEDWDAFYQQITDFLNKLYQVKDDTLEYDDYDEFPYKIYQIEPSLWNNSKNKISRNARSGDLSEFDNFLTKYSLDVELENADALEDYFAANETIGDCVLFVTYKKYLVIMVKNNQQMNSNSKRVLHWAPSYLTLKNLDNGNEKDVNWDKEFSSLKKDASKYFNLVNNNKITLERADENTDLECGDDIQSIWEDLASDDTVTTIKVEVGGESRSAPVKRNINSQAEKPLHDSVTTQKFHPAPDKQDEKKNDDNKGGDELDFDFDGPILIPLNNRNEVKDQRSNDKFKVNIDEKILVKINRIDKILIDFDESGSGLSEDIEKELEFICDNLRKRQKGVSLLQDEKNQEKMSQGTEKLFEALKKRLNWITNLMKNNDDYDDKNKIVQAVKKAYDACVYNRDLSSASIELVKAMKQVRAFDIEETISLFNKTMEASENVKGKDICLLLGKTGAGKSTTIHFLAGSEMVCDANTGHIEPRKGGIKNHHLKNVKTEWTVTESVTRYIAGVPIKLSDFGVQVGYRSSSKKLVTLCDAPGFDDSGGPEIDVANGLGIVYGVSQARSAKILLVLTKANVDDERMKGIKDVSHTLSKIFPNFTQHMAAIDVIFTKMDITKVQLRNKIKKGIKELGDKDNEDEAFLTLLHYIAGLSDDKIIFLNPVPNPASKAPEIRKKILETLFHQSATWIHYPKEHFKKFVTESSLSAIDQQLLLHEAAISKAVNDTNNGADKNTNYQLIGTKIGQLRKLHQLLDFESIKQSLNSCNKIVLKKWNQRCEDAKKQLVTSTKSLSLEEFEIDLKNYKEMLKESQECEMLQKELTKQQEDAEQKSDNDNSNGELSMTGTESLELTLNTQMEYLVDNCTLDFKSEIYFDKAQIMIKIFGNTYKAVYDKKLNELSNDIHNLNIETVKMIDDNKDFEQIYGNFCKLASMTHLNHIFGGNTLSKLEEHLIKHLTKGSDFIEQTFRVDTSFASIGNVNIIPNDAINECKQCISRIENGHKAFGTKTMIYTDDNDTNMGNTIEKLYEYTVSVIVEFCRQHRSMIEGVLAGGGNDGFRFVSDSDSAHSGQSGYVNSARMNDENYNHEQLEQYVAQLSKIHQFNNDIKVKAASIYYHTIEFVFRYFDNERRTFNQMVDKIENNDSNIKYGELVRQVMKLRESGWLQKYRDPDSNNNESNNTNSNFEILEKIEIKLIHHVNTLLQDANALYIDIRDGTKIKCVKKMMSNLKELRKLERLLPGIETQIEQVARVLQAEVVETLFEINKYCQTNSLEKWFDNSNDHNGANSNSNNSNEDNKNNKNNKNAKNGKKSRNKDRHYLPAQWFACVVEFLHECNMKNGTWFDHIDVVITNTDDRTDEKFESDNKQSEQSERTAQTDVEKKDENKEIIQSKDEHKHVNHNKNGKRIKVQREIRETRSIVEEFVQTYGRLRSEEMEDAFDYLCDISSGSGINAIESGWILSDCLREFNNFDLHYNDLMQYLIPDDVHNEAILTRMHQRLIEQHGNLEMELNKMVNSRDARLQIGVLHAKGLSKCDWFLR